MKKNNLNYDILIIGAGPAGYMCALRASQLGHKVALIEKTNTLGGTCLNVGCIPSKFLLDTSHKYWQAKNHFQSIGIETEGVSFNLNKIMERKNRIITDLVQGIHYLLKKQQVDLIEGTASFTKDGSLRITQNQGDSLQLSASSIVVAVGSSPQTLKDLQIDGANVLSSEHILSLKHTPKHLAVVGGGYIGLELGSVWSRFGSKVTIIESSKQILGQQDPDVQRFLQQALEEQNIIFKLDHKVIGLTIHNDQKSSENQKFYEENGHLSLYIQKNETKDQDVPEILTCDAVLVAAGRKPAVNDLNLGEVGIQTDKDGYIQVDRRFQTSRPGVYAIGDCIKGPMLAHKGMDEGIALAELLSGQAGAVNYHVIPSVIFTHPEIATVGHTEKNLKDKKISYKVGKFNYNANGRARTINEDKGFVKILSDRASGRILGCTVVGHDAGTLIAQVASVMELSGTAEDIARTCHAHPTLNEIIKEAAWGAFDHPIHA